MQKQIIEARNVIKCKNWILNLRSLRSWEWLWEEGPIEDYDNPGCLIELIGWHGECTDCNISLVK